MVEEKVHGVVSSSLTTVATMVTGNVHAKKMKRLQKKKSSVAITPSTPSIPKIDGVESVVSSPSLERSSNKPSKSSKYILKSRDIVFKNLKMTQPGH